MIIYSLKDLKDLLNDRVRLIIYLAGKAYYLIALFLFYFFRNFFLINNNEPSVLRIKIIILFSFLLLIKSLILSGYSRAVAWLRHVAKDTVWLVRRHVSLIA